MLKIGVKHSGSFKSGDNHPNWKGGVTPLNNKIRHCARFRQWRENIFRRDGFTCQDCGCVGGVLHPAHKKPLASIIADNRITSLEEAYLCDELWDTDNGRTLCYRCHGKEHNIEFNPKGNRNRRHLKCVICGNGFTKSTRTSKIHPVKTCGATCKAELARRRFRKGKVIECLHCNKRVFKHPRDIRNNKRLFCSVDCYFAHRRIVALK